MTRTGTVPQLRELDERDVSSILARNYVGRLANAWGGRLDIRPFHYVYADHSIYGRTSHGAKFEELESLPAPVVFEVDEVEAMFRWRCVLVRGEFDVLYPEGTKREEWRRAVEQLRRLIPHLFDAEDPVSHRSVIFRISIQEATGRAME